MGLLNYETKKAPKGLWIKRFFAFCIDFAIVLSLLFIVYNISGEPDYHSVKKAMDAYTATGNKDASLQQEVITTFGRCYAISLLIWFFYETMIQMLCNGATVGKLIMQLRIVSMNPKQNKLIHILLMTLRSGLKILSLYFFQAFPFIICQLTILTNAECRSGFDMAVKTKVIHISNRKESMDYDNFS
jgi:uncharacterized RDD family membrane protein YckC